MNALHKALGAALLPLLFGMAPCGASPVIRPVTPDAMPEAAALLATLQEISGRYTLTGQQNPPATGDRNSRFAAAYTGKTPAVWTSDFGFGGSGDTDSFLARPALVQEAIRQHRRFIHGSREGGGADIRLRSSLRNACGAVIREGSFRLFAPSFHAVTQGRFILGRAETHSSVVGALCRPAESRPLERAQPLDFAKGP